MKKERQIIEIQIEKFSDNNYGYKVLGIVNVFMALEELFDYIKKHTKFLDKKGLI